MAQSLFPRPVQGIFSPFVIYRSLILAIGLSFLQILASPSLALSSREAEPGVGLISLTQEDQQLESGKPIQRELAGGQSHSYQITLDAGQYLQLVVEQRGIDVVIQLWGPDGKQIAEFNFESWNRGRETVEHVAEAKGSYRLNVHPKQKGSMAGRYEIQVKEVRAATESDRALQEARNLLAENIKLQSAAKYDEALPIIERALEIRERVLGPDHPDLAACLNSLGILYKNKGDLVKAEALYQRALAIREKTMGSEHPGVAAVLNNLAIVYRDRGEIAKAEELHQRALSIREIALGPEHPDFAQSLNNLALILRSRGEYGKAELMHQRSLNIWEKAFGPEDTRVARSLHSLAFLYWESGEYAKSEPLYQRALAIFEKTLGPEHPDYAQTLNNLALLYYYRGDYVKAEPSFHRALKIYEKTLGPSHSSIANPVTNLALLYRDLGEYAKAEPFYLRALSIREKALGPKHPLVAAALDNLALLYHDMRDYAKAEPLQQRALAIFKEALGPEHPEVGAALNNLALLYRDKGDYTKAEPLFRQTLDLWEKVLGAHHPNVAETLNELAVLYAAKGDIAQATTFQSRANAIREHNLAHNLAAGSERQKLAYLALFSKDTDFTLSLHSQFAPDDPQALNLALTTLLRRKGRGLDAMTDTIANLRRRATPHDQAIFDKLADARSQLAALTLKDASANPDAYRAQLKPLEEKVESLEAELSTRRVEFRAQSQPVTISAVQAIIPEGSALIEFVVYTPQDPRTRENLPPRYLAYLLAAQGQPKWVDLGEAAAIDRAVDAWRKSLRNPNRPDVKRLARSLDDKVMRPVRSLLREMPCDNRRLLIAPDGSLNLIPFAALVDERNQYLVEHYTISYLTSGSELLRLKTSQPSKNAPLVVANPTFDRDSTNAMRGVRKSGKSEASNQGRTQIDPIEVIFSPLPGTMAEALAVKAVLPDATLLLRGQATETAIKQVSRPRILHIATHGFFLNDQESPLAETRGILADDPLRISDQRLNKWAAYIKDPLLRSGLALAGANQSQSGDDDGLLTALEMVGLDLWGTRLVVLSACDTGVGEVKNGEGVQGMRRALVLAGSESQLMSLWSVVDKVTKELMIPYYKGLQQGEGRSDGLRQVQLQMLQSRFRKHPFYWAAFILSGDWTKLEGRR
jgi:CHAT domain-containing protein/Tfp pilus assembly protein PilF